MAKFEDNNSKKEKLDIKDEEDYDYRTGEDLNFSHQILVMQSFRRIIELGGHELCHGTYETTTDPRTQKTKVVYKEDTIKAFFEAIKTAKDICECDFDKDAKDNIKKLLDDLGKKKNEYLNDQVKWFNKLSPLHQKNFGNIQVNNLVFNLKLPHYYNFLEFKIETYRKLFAEMNMLTKRLDFFRAEEVEA